ncbi:uncharacterized protein PAC_18321 [Phialocephala subalpina]|uniref:Uncharacterized protein n=1 Tax=Phialocephala subalpina TaxID=576137 RepID=A0A1L7XTR9_9HELO|nr:uncharacterized protein PAC_18321 [Phialocephala subalpina]
MTRQTNIGKRFADPISSRGQRFGRCSRESTPHRRERPFAGRTRHLIKSELQQVIAYVYPARRTDGTQIKRRQLGFQHVENLAESAMAAIEYPKRELERHVKNHTSWTQLIVIAHRLSSRTANIGSILTTRPTNGTQNHEYSEASHSPIDVQLDQNSMISVNRVKASPMYHNLQILRERGTVENNKFRLLPLQELELKVQRVIGVDAHKKIEKKVPIMAEPWWMPPNIRIAPGAKTAAKEHNELRKVNLVTHMQVFTDDCDIQGRVGAAAWEPHRRWRCQVDIGPSDQFTV